MRKRVTIEIPPDDVRALRANGETLCIAKKVRTRGYNVICWADSRYSVSNSFEWMPEFQIFGSKRFAEGERVTDMTGAVDMVLGGHMTFEEQGRFGPAPPRGDGDGEALNLTNRFGPIHVGIRQRCVVSGTEVVAPIHLTSERMRTGMVSLRPIDRVLIWFEQWSETGMIFTHPRPHAIESI